MRVFERDSGVGMRQWLILVLAMLITESILGEDSKYQRCSVGNYSPGCRLYQFEHVSGDHPLCEAHLKHLNVTLMRHPYCSLKYELRSHGISPLERLELADQDAFVLDYEVTNFESGVRDRVSLDRKFLRHFRAVRGGSVDAWLYKVDTDGDGSRESLLNWVHGSCNPDQNSQRLQTFLLNPDSLTIDWEGTLKMFVKPKGEWRSHRPDFIAFDTDLFVFADRAYLRTKHGHEHGLDFNVFEFQDETINKLCTSTWKGE